MAESIYPTAIDGYSQLPLVVDNVTEIDAKSVNRLRNAIVNIEKTLGISPAGDFISLVERLNDADTQTASAVEDASHALDIVNDAIDSESTNASDIATLQSDLATAQTDILSLQEDVLELQEDTGGSGAPTDASYIVIGANATLTAERTLAVGTGLDLVDNGANSTVEIDLDLSEVAAGGDLGGNMDAPTVTQARGLRETAGPTTLAIGTITNAQWLKRSGTTITSASINFIDLSGNATVSQGGTNITSYTLGDTIYASDTLTLSKLSGNTTSTKKFQTQTGDGVASAAPIWSTIVSGDLPSFGGDVSGTIGSLTVSQARGLRETTGPTTLTMAGVADAEILKRSGTTVTSIAFSFSNISGTAGATQGGTGASTYALGDTIAATATNTLSKISGNTSATKKFYTQTGDGAASASPGWNTVVIGDLPIDADGTLAGNSDSFLATQKATKTYADLKLAKASNLSDLGSASTARTNLGLGTIATQAANNVSISGGSITGITDLAPADGGTGIGSYALGDTIVATATNVLGKISGNISATKKFYTQTGDGAASASPGWNTVVIGDLPIDTDGTLAGNSDSFLATQKATKTYADLKLAKALNLSDLANASTARTNLGLGTIATQAANNVTITGGSITGITDLAPADGGTGMSSYTTGDILVATSSTVLGKLTAGILGAAFYGQGAGVVPTFSTTRWHLGFVEQAWSTAVGVAVETGVPAVDGDYSLTIEFWIEATSGGALRRAGVWYIMLRRTSGTLAIPSSGTVELGAAGGGAPSQAWAVSGDDLTHTITSVGRSGRVAHQVTGLSWGDLLT